MNNLLIDQIKFNNHIFIIHFLIINLFLVLNSYAQTVIINGKVLASRYPVQNASITFIDNSDTTKKFFALTDQSGNYQVDLTVTSVIQLNTLPTNFELEQNYPNPFSNLTNIPYKLNTQSDALVTIYDILGREIRKIPIGYQPRGIYRVIWDGKNNYGEQVATGIYFYKLQAGQEIQVKKMVFGSVGTNVDQLSPMHMPQRLESEFQMKANYLNENYTVRIENTNNTLPFIISAQVENIFINNDTTLNFSVNYIPVATIDNDSLHQIISGFGAASPWYLPVMTDSEIESAFGIDNGEIGLSIFRITVEADSNLWAKWVPSTKRAQVMGAKIIASPWYAPTDMVETVNNISRVRHDMYGKYVAHLNSFITYMKNHGVTIYGVSVQNEPDITDNWTSWTSDEMFSFMKNYADSIEGTRVMDPESYHFNRTYSDPILNDSAACANTDIICGHIYGGGLSKYPFAEEKGKEVWMTEYLMGENNSGNNLSWAIKLAQNINDVMSADMSAYVWWTMVRYYGPIGDGTKATNPADPNEIYPDKGEVTKKGYVMSQFAKFIRPGYYRVESSVYPTLGAASVTSYKDLESSKLIIVAVNSGSSPLDQLFRIQNGIMSPTFTPYTTSETKNCEQGTEFNVTGDHFTFTLEPSSITTFVTN
jgi:glucuronoarabinoxylan endo-1,4-beta-xylanase